MKCTNTYNLFKEIDALERRELIAAVMAHGGEYIFFDCSGDENDVDGRWRELEDTYNIPVVLGSRSWEECHTDYYVTKVTVENGWILHVYGFCKAHGNWPSDEDLIDNIEWGHISFITDDIPETEDLKDVSEKKTSMPVLVVSRADLEAKGFDPNIPDADFEMFVHSMEKHLDMDDFWLSLEYAAEHVGIPRKEVDDA